MKHYCVYANYSLNYNFTNSCFAVLLPGLVPFRSGPYPWGKVIAPSILSGKPVPSSAIRQMKCDRLIRSAPIRYGIFSSKAKATRHVVKVYIYYISVKVVYI